VDEVTARECEVTGTSSLCVSGVRWWTRSAGDFPGCGHCVEFHSAP